MHMCMFSVTIYMGQGSINERKCANRFQCISESDICDGVQHCKDNSDELCSDSCLKKLLGGKTIIRKCLEDSSVCVPVEKYCDRVADCPYGSDEANCSCEAWDMHQCHFGGSSMCS